MVYLELSKKYIAKYYNGSKGEALKAKDGIIFDDEKVEKAFSDGWDDFLRYMNNNRQYCYYVRI